MITIGIPKIKKINKKARLTVEVEINEEIKELWLEVDEKYGRYLVTDRCDAFVIALLPIAMRNRKELVCLSPVSEELLHNLRTQLIPTLAKFGKNFYRTRISAEVNKKPIKNIGAVGTGMAGGVDSMHVLSQYTDTDYPSMKLTHLCIHDTGAFDIPSYNEGGRSGKTVKESLINKFSKMAEEMDIPLIVTESNLSEDFNVTYAINHIYCNLFPVFALQKLFGIYYYGSSGMDFSQFSLDECDRFDCGRYELLAGYALSTSNLKIYIEGGEKNRLEKIEDIIHFSPAQKYLNVCMTGSENCNICRKCMSTLLALDSINRLDYFSNVFDVDYYKKNKQRYVAYLNKCHQNQDKLCEPIYERFKKRKMTSDSNPEILLEGVELNEQIHTSALIIKSLKTGKILMQKQTKESFSTVVFAKIIIALIALESGNSQMQIEIPEKMFKDIKSATLYDLVNVLIITQNNLVSELIAEAISGTIDDFIKLMNKKAVELGLKNTNFTSVTGLGNNSHITAEDAYKLVECAIQNKHFCQIFGRRSYKIVSGGAEKVILTSNALLKDNSEYFIPECLGAKYGSIGTTGNVVAVAQKDDDLFVAVLLGIKETNESQYKYSDTKNLLRSLLDC